MPRLRPWKRRLQSSKRLFQPAKIASAIRLSASALLFCRQWGKPISKSWNTNKLTLPLATLSRTASPLKVIITNEADLPSAFLIEKTELRPDKKALMDALKAGAVPGAELSNGGEQLAVRWI